MDRDYLSELFDVASQIVELADVESSLDKRDWKRAKEQHDSLEASFDKLRNEYVDHALEQTKDGRLAYQRANDELSRIRHDCDPSWIPAVDYTSNRVLPYFEKQANRHPKLRKAIKLFPWTLGGIALVAYFAVRILSATPIDQPITTQKGIEERAAAVEKVIRHDEWMATHVRKGGWLKGILLWPIAPTDKEVKGASEFAALAFEAQQVSVNESGCMALPQGTGNVPSKEEIEYLSATAEYLRDSSTQWKSPAPLTAVDAARKVGGC